MAAVEPGSLLARVGRRGGVRAALLVVLFSQLCLASLDHTRAAAAASLRFDGSSSHLRVPDSPTLRIPSNLTIEAWFKPASVSGHRHIVGKNNDELAVEPMGSGFKVTFEFSVGGTWWTVASGQLALNQWYHAAGTYEGATMRLFVDGALVASQPAAGTIDQTSNPRRAAAHRYPDQHADLAGRHGDADDRRDGDVHRDAYADARDAGAAARKSNRA